MHRLKRIWLSALPALIAAMAAAALVLASIAGFEWAP